MDAQQWTVVLLSHGLQVTALVIIVAGTTKWWLKSRPHVAHVLWLLVLLKCLMPPTFASPTSFFSWLSLSYCNSQSPSFSPFDTTNKNKGSLASSPSSQQGFTVRYGPEITSSDTNTFDSTATPTTSSIGPYHQRSGAWSKLLLFALTWLLLGFVINLSLTAYRLRSFLRQAYADGYHEDATLNQLTEQLRDRFGLRRRVDVHVIHRAIGPVVVGWLHPRLLLPAVIVEGKSTSQLEPLIAHELIHIRRGDLWWAWVQVLATCLWWFHPLVHWSSRMLIRESERSCDEETVMSLGCSPSTYARALLDVLEHKHQLKIAPALPGVRPVDVTLERMERIMQLGQGCHQRAPRWVWGLLLFGCAVALPSAAVSVAQDEKPQATEPNSTVIAHVPEAKSPIADEFQNYRCDVGDLLDMLHASNFSKEEAIQRLLQQIPARKGNDLDEVVSKLGLPGQLSIKLPEPRIVDRELQLFELKAQIEAVKNALAHLRKTGFRQVTCEVKFVTCAPDAYRTIVSGWPHNYERFVPDSSATGKKIELNIPLRDLTNPADNSLFIESADGFLFGTGKWIKSSSGQLKSGRVKGKTDALTLNTNNMQALIANPSANVLSGPKVLGTSGQQFSVATRTQTTVQGKTDRPVWKDTQVEIQPVVIDDKTLQVSFALQISQSPIAPNSEGEHAPSKIVLRIALGHRLESGETLFVGGIPQKIDGQDRILMICLTPTIGGFEHKRVHWEPIIKSDVIGQTHQLNLLGPLASATKTAELEPPTDDELLQLIQKQRAMVGDAPLSRDQLPRFALKKIALKTDPVRFVPLIGNAKLHHTIYECTMTREQFPGIQEVLTIDHNQFEMIKED